MNKFLKGATEVIGILGAIGFLKIARRGENMQTPVGFVLFGMILIGIGIPISCWFKDRKKKN